MQTRETSEQGRKRHRNNIGRRNALAVGAAFLLAACGRPAGTAETVEGFALGTVYKVTVSDKAPDSLREKVEGICAAADSSMSVFNPRSLLSRINRNETDSLNEDIIRNIELARSVSELSGGKYDITVQPLVDAYGFIDGRQAAEVNVDSLLRYVGYEKITIREGRLVKQYPEIQIGLNSIAKGYTVDKIARMLEQEGASDYLVNVGGEIFCRGVNPSGERWHIAIDTPYEGNYLPGASTSTVINVSEAGIATSGNYRNFHTGPDGRKYTHIIDPTTGGNTESNLLSATVVAESCTLADAMATMYMALGLEGSLALLAEHPEFAVLLIYADGNGEMKMHISPAMEQYMCPPPPEVFRIHPIHTPQPVRTTECRPPRGGHTVRPICCGRHSAAAVRSVSIRKRGNPSGKMYKARMAQSLYLCSSINKKRNTMQSVTLNNGVEMPQLGYGVYLVAPETCERCVLDAIGAGYRSIDTAQAYYNEAGVGAAIAKCGIPRSELFITTKVWISNAGEERAAASIEESLRKLHTDYIDLLLIHQPFADYYGTYRAMEKAVRAGKVRAIGVSNFYPDRFVDLAENVEIKPAVNQLKTNVFSQQWDSEREMEQYGTKIMAWAPIAQADADLFENPTLQAIAESHGRTVAQVALRYLIQRGIIAIPKTTHIDRMKENLDIFDFELSAAEMDSIRPLDRPREFQGSHRDPELVRFLLDYDKKFNPANK